MNMSTITIEQGGMISLTPEEIPVIQSILTKRNISWESLDVKQGIVKVPQQYVGYFGLPNRRIIIKPKHEGVTLSHILRIYYFLYSAEYSDLDTPMYDIEAGNDINLISMFMQELMDVIHRGLPVEYTEKNDNLRFVRGHLNIVETKKNMLQQKTDIFNCDYDDLSRDIPINRLLLVAIKKIDLLIQDFNFNYIITQFSGVDYKDVPSNIETNRNTAYCKKAISLAYMIINDLTISVQGDKMSGESLLINFDRVFEEFVKKILLEHSGNGRFTYWGFNRVYAHCKNEQEFFERSYQPDLLYDFKESDYLAQVRVVLDVKNKTSQPFSNPDVYQMIFYAQMLHSKKVILCYPSNYNRESCALRFSDEKFFLQKIYASYINLVGETAKEFKDNIFSFIYRVECLL